MTLLFDRLIALLVSGSVMLLLVNFQLRAQQTALGQSMISGAKTQIFSLAEILERDLMNAGYETPPGQEGILAHSSTYINAIKVTDVFEFWSLVDSTRTRLRYELVEHTPVDLDEEYTPIFELKRYWHNGAQWVASGGSSPILTHFRIDMRTDKNQSTNDVAAARSLRLRLGAAVMPSVGENQFLRGMRKLHWGAQLHPAHLRGYANE